MSDIFISYAREDRTCAESVAKALGEKGWSVWYDLRLEAGEVWDEVIASKIEDAKIVLVLWSPASIKSRWVKNEARFAAGQGKLVPVLIRSAQIPLEFTHLQAQDLTAWRGDPSQKVLAKLADILARRLGPMPSGIVGSEKRSLVWNYRPWLLSAALMAFGAAGSGFFLLFGNHQSESGSESTKLPNDGSGAHQRMVISQTEGESDSTNTLKDESGAHRRTVIAVPGDKTLAEWTPGCLYEVRAEKQANGTLRACFDFDPNECFISAGIMQGTDILKSGMPVFVTLGAARDRWAAGTLSRISDGRYYVQLRTVLECAKGGKPGIWVGADGVVALREGD